MTPKYQKYRAYNLAYQHRYYKRNRRRILRYDRSYRKKNCISMKAKAAAYYQKTRERQRSLAAIRYRQDPKKHVRRVGEWRKRNPEKARAAKLRAYTRLRNLVVDSYGGACACCKESERLFLCVDHKGGGGNKHRKIVSPGWQLYQWLKRRGFPKEKFQLLCHNCNFAERFGQPCPHKTRQGKNENLR